MSNQLLARNIKDRMYALDIRSAAELARRAGVKEGVIRFYLRGESKNPSKENSRLQAIAVALETTADALLAPPKAAASAGPQAGHWMTERSTQPENEMTLSAAQQVLKNVMFDVGEQPMTDEESIQMAVAIQEALRKIKK